MSPQDVEACETDAPKPQVHGYSKSSFPAMGLAALGIVFGDIGTSPLYTLKTVLASEPNHDASAILGVFSLLTWTLIIITTIKYVIVAMSIDNDGEGGILALMSLIGIKKKVRPAVVFAGLFGAALIYGDGAVTPAISVLSALEGLNIVTPAVTPYVLPGAVVILLLLFVVQPFGTQFIGKAFGPVMAFWFVTIAIMGFFGILHHPAVLEGLNPYYALHYLVSGGIKGFLVLGGIFLCVTGAEALYADMGHFGPKPIRAAWLAIVFPSLILNYAGQSAILLEGASADSNIFFRLCPQSALIPLIVLATLATIIASQAVITGAFSMTRQAIRLGWLPRVAVKQTSDEGYGQVYVGTVNWMLMIVTIALAVGFKKSDNLAGAYGVAVSLTMLLTTVLLFIAMRGIWKWSLPAAAALAGFFFIVDAAFFSANIVKVADGGYAPLLIAAFVYTIMWVWHRGSQAVAQQLEQDIVEMADFLSEVAAQHIPRVPGTAIFLTRTNRDIPPVLSWHLKHNRALHEKLMVLTVKTTSIPRTASEDRLKIQNLAPDFWRGEAVFGFMEHPNIPALLTTAKKQGCDLDLSDVTYYVGHETIQQQDDGRGLPHWVEGAFAYMARNSTHVGELLRLPEEKTVEIGRQIKI